jgi:hypothetical protein
MVKIPVPKHTYIMHVKYFPIVLENFLMIASAGRNMLRCIYVHLYIFIYNLYLH